MKTEKEIRDKIDDLMFLVDQRNEDGVGDTPHVHTINDDVLTLVDALLWVLDEEPSLI